MTKGFRSPSKVVRRLKLLPRATRKLTSWPRFMYNYSLGFVPDAPYAFRNGARMKIGRAVDHVPMIEIFLRKDYGDVADGAVVLDIGANIGTFSIYAATTARDVKIYAYEPMAEFYQLMLENIALNRLTGSVKCFNTAVGPDSCARELAVEGTNIFFPTLTVPKDRVTRNVSVPCTTLAEILHSNRLTKVDLLKMDCEGAEYEIFYNTPPSCFERIREIRMEYHDLPGEGRNLDSLLAFLESQNYEITLTESASVTEPIGNLWARRHG